MMFYIVSFVVIVFVVFPLVTRLDDYIDKRVDDYIEDRKAQKESSFYKDKR